MLKLLLLLLLVAVASAVHDRNFCSISPNTGVSLPAVPDTFTMTVTTKEAGSPVLSAMEFYDKQSEMSAFYIGQSDSSAQVIINYKTMQAVVVDRSSKRIPGNCDVQTVRVNELLVGVVLPLNVRASVPSRFFFFGQGDEGVEDRGTENVDGLQLKKYYSCYYLASFDTSLEITWYYEIDGRYITPVRVNLRQKDNKNNKESSSVLEIARFRAGKPTWTMTTNPFMAPPGVYCRGLITMGRTPPMVPDRFSMRMEELVDDVKATVYLREAYDFQSNLSLLQRDPPSGEAPGKYGPGKITYLHDFRRNQAFITNDAFGNCSFEKIKGTEWDAEKDLGDVRMRSPKEFFNLNWKEVQYKGSVQVRGIDTDVYIGFKQMKSGIADITYNTTIEWFFANKTIKDLVQHKTVTVAAPMAIRTTSDAPWLNSWLYIYDFDTKEMHFNRHDITQCFGKNGKQTFLVTFPLSSPQLASDVKRRPSDFVSTVLLAMSGVLDISSLRLLDPELSVEADSAVLKVTVTDRPSCCSGTDLSQVEGLLGKAISAGNLIAIFNAGGGTSFATASKYDTFVPNNDSKSVGYGAGAVAGAAVGLLLAGLVAGLIAAFLYLR